jgi:hypothetical protein
VGGFEHRSAEGIGTSVTETEDDLRTTAEAIIADAETIKDIEKEKLDLDADDPRIPGLADQAEGVAKRLLQEASMERELATTLAEEARRPEAP